MQSRSIGVRYKALATAGSYLSAAPTSTRASDSTVRNRQQTVVNLGLLANQTLPKPQYLKHLIAIACLLSLATEPETLSAPAAQVSTPHPAVHYCTSMWPISLSKPDSRQLTHDQFQIACSRTRRHGPKPQCIEKPSL